MAVTVPPETVRLPLSMPRPPLLLSLDSLLLPLPPLAVTVPPETVRLPLPEMPLPPWLPRALPPLPPVAVTVLSETVRLPLPKMRMPLPPALHPCHWRHRQWR